MTAVYPEPKEGSQRVPEYKFDHFMKLPLMQLLATRGARIKSEQKKSEQENVRTGKCQNKNQEKVGTEFVLTVEVQKQKNIRTENVRMDFSLQ